LQENFWNEDRQLFDEFYYEQGEKKIDGHFGYLNLFPVYLNALPSVTKALKVVMKEAPGRKQWNVDQIWSKIFIFEGFLFSRGRQLLD
jgi:hypothetical protein